MLATGDDCHLLLQQARYILAVALPLGEYTCNMHGLLLMCAQCELEAALHVYLSYAATVWHWLQLDFGQSLLGRMQRLWRLYPEPYCSD